MGQGGGVAVEAGVEGELPSPEGLGGQGGVEGEPPSPEGLRGAGRGGGCKAQDRYLFEVQEVI